MRLTPLDTAALDSMGRFYDLDHNLASDLPLYENVAKRTGSPALDLGCGTGRVALHLARAGYAVTALDASTAMLAFAQAKTPETVAQHLTFVEADVRRFDLGQRFALAFYALGTFQHLLTASDQLASLLCAREHLVAGGVLALDVAAPCPAQFGRNDGEVLLAWVKDSAAGTVAKLVSLHDDWATGTQSVTYFYDETDPQRGLRRTVARFALRWPSRGEIEALFRESGFTLEGTYGSYDLDALTVDSERMIFIARGE